jgi:hypothetical protein
VLVAVYNIAHGVRDFPYEVLRIKAIGEQNSSYLCAIPAVIDILRTPNVDFAALHPEHHLLNAVVACVLYSLVGRNQSPSEFYIHWGNVE